MFNWIFKKAREEKLREENQEQRIARLEWWCRLLEGQSNTQFRQSFDLATRLTKVEEAAVLKVYAENPSQPPKEVPLEDFLKALCDHLGVFISVTPPAASKLVLRPLSSNKPDFV